MTTLDAGVRRGTAVARGFRRDGTPGWSVDLSVGGVRLRSAVFDTIEEAERAAAKVYRAICRPRRPTTYSGNAG